MTPIQWFTFYTILAWISYQQVRTIAAVKQLEKRILDADIERLRREMRVIK